MLACWRGTERRQNGANNGSRVLKDLKDLKEQAGRVSSKATASQRLLPFFAPNSDADDSPLERTKNTVKGATDAETPLDAFRLAVADRGGAPADACAIGLQHARRQGHGRKVRGRTLHCVQALALPGVEYLLPLMTTTCCVACQNAVANQSLPCTAVYGPRMFREIALLGDRRTAPGPRHADARHEIADRVGSAV